MTDKEYIIAILSMYKEELVPSKNAILEWKMLGYSPEKAFLLLKNYPSRLLVNKSTIVI